MIPDASVILKNRIRPRQEKYIAGAPEIAIEVVSPSETATHLKANVDAYLEAGAKSVWVVYPDARAVMIHSVDAVREVKGEQTIEDALLPGFAGPVSRFFELT